MVCGSYPAFHCPPSSSSVTQGAAFPKESSVLPHCPEHGAAFAGTSQSCGFSATQPKEMAQIYSPSHELQAQLLLDLGSSSSLQKTLHFLWSFAPRRTQANPGRSHVCPAALLIAYCKKTALKQSSQTLQKAQGHAIPMLKSPCAPESVP